MHIIFATMQYGADYYQGTERYIYNLSAGLIKHGHRVTILTGDPKYMHSSTEVGGNVYTGTPEIIKIPSPSWTSVLGGNKTTLRNIIGPLNADIFHFVNPGHIGLNSIFAAKELGLKIVITVTDFWWLCPKHTLTTATGNICAGNKSAAECRRCITESHVTPIYRQLAGFPPTRTLLSGLLHAKLLSQGVADEWKNRPQHISAAFQAADHVITLSLTAAKYLAAHYNINASTKIEAGLSDLWFEREKSWQVRDFTKKKPIIAYAGTIARHKGLHILIDAVKMLPHNTMELSIAGSSSDQSYLDNIKQQAGEINIQWKGQLEQKEMCDFIDSADLVVVPSLWSENQPQIILESMARNTPVLCSDAPGAAELIHPDYVYSAHQPQALSKLLTNWLAAPSFQPVNTISSTHDMVSQTRHIYENIN
jgi:glycosyltransferase involved in cell wall biosynthesis